MSDSDPNASSQASGEDDPRIPTRPLFGFILVLMPIVGVFLVTIAYVVMWSLGLAGRSAQGEEVTWRFSGCEAALPLLEARLDDVGLSATWTSTSGGYTVTTQLTGDETVDEGLPAMLTTPADLEIRAGDQVLATSADVTDASVRMDIFMVPFVLLKVDEDAAERIKVHVRQDPEGKMAFHVDGRKIGWQSNANPVAIGELEVNLELEGDEKDRMQAVASWSVTLDHGPLPCSVTFRGETVPVGRARDPS